MISGNIIDELSRDELLELVKSYAKNWLAHDGCWFLSIEEQHGISTAIDIDREAWRKFSVIEATRIKNMLGLKTRPGVEGLRRAFGFRLYTTINEDMIEVIDDKTMRYYVKTCRVQAARRNKGLKDFPCASVGIVEYSYFAKTIDDRFQTIQISCPPDITNHYFHCIWEFRITENEE